MERLTSNKPVDEMNMVELAHNCCYAKDRRARYRDFSIDVDARELTRELLKKYAEGDDAFTCDEDFDEEMIDYLQYGTETLEGLIALFYQNLWAMADIRERLKAYEDAGAQGLLLMLPFKIGQKVYYIYESCIDKSLMIGSMVYSYSCLDFPREYFATKEEAKQALKDMQGV